MSCYALLHDLPYFYFRTLTVNALQVPALPTFVLVQQMCFVTRAGCSSVLNPLPVVGGVHRLFDSSLPFCWLQSLCSCAPGARGSLRNPPPVLGGLCYFSLTWPLPCNPPSVIKGVRLLSYIFVPSFLLQ